MFKFSSRFILFTTVLSLVGCGFHLRGAFDIPKSLQTLRILPKDPFDPFQRALKQTLSNNGAQIISSSDSESKGSATLTLLNQTFSERNVAYGSDGQPNRALLKFTVSYQLIDTQGKTVISHTSVQVERELTLNPTTFLATNNERSRLKNDLIVDAATQLVRQLIRMSNP
jgi:LPS-assembly lipoprotein